MENDKMMNEIIDRIKNIIKSRFETDFNADVNAHLLGSEVGMNHRALIYLFFDIEREFDISIPQEDIINGKFTSIKKIAELIGRQIKIKESVA